jgi:hypothetical protein
MGIEDSLDWNRSCAARMVLINPQRVSCKVSNMRIIDRVIVSVASLVLTTVAAAAEPSNGIHQVQQGNRDGAQHIAEQR